MPSARPYKEPCVSAADWIHEVLIRTGGASACFDLLRIIGFLGASLQSAVFPLGVSVCTSLFVPYMFRAPEQPFSATTHTATITTSAAALAAATIGSPAPALVVAVVVVVTFQRNQDVYLHKDRFLFSA